MRLLIVEDSAANAAFLRMGALKAGYEVLGIFTDADSSYQFLNENRGLVDIVLIDIFLSGEKTGIDLIKMLPEQDRPAVIFITASEDPEISKEAGSVSPYGFLIKPFKELVLRNTLEIVSQRLKAEKGFQRRIAFERLVADI